MVLIDEQSRRDIFEIITLHALRDFYYIIRYVFLT